MGKQVWHDKDPWLLKGHSPEQSLNFTIYFAAYIIYTIKSLPSLSPSPTSRIYQVNDTVRYHTNQREIIQRLMNYFLAL